MKKYTISNVISSFSVKPNGSMSMLLGAGASISSGIMSGGQMVWDFKRKIYCIENKISEAVFPDMSKETAQREIQVYLDTKREHPSLYSTEEYSHYFEYLFGNSRDRDLYIQSKVKNAMPYLGYLCLGALIIQRGTVIQLNKDTFLIWTHGAVQNDELAGRNMNYYKNGRGIPAPLLVKRFMGKSDGATLVNEIMMLTKMNWNSGDSFYKVLPVTLDFAKMLSQVAKQDVVIYDKPYDFRYFM